MRAKIGLDAGHGGKNSGTYTVNSPKDGLFEKDYALEFCLLVEKNLLRNGFQTVLTRRTDKIPGGVNERAAMLAEENCDFALSVHFNGHRNKTAEGTEVFVPYGEDIGLVEANFMRELGKFFRLREPFARSSSYYNRSEIFDKKLDPETGKFGAAADKKDYFGFIRTAWEKGLSADLLEICFLTNETDFEIYTAFKEEIAAAVAKSIVKSFGEEYINENQRPFAKQPGKVFFNTVNLPK